MKLKKLLSLVPFDEIKKDLSFFFPKGRKKVSLEKYKEFYSNLLKKRSKNKQNLTIVFENLNGNIFVNGKDQQTNEIYALDLCTFSEWLSFEIKIEDLKPPMTISKAISSILWEMTFYGMTDKEIYYRRRVLSKLTKKTYRNVKMKEQILN